MRWMSRAWVGSTVALVLVTLFLTGCPKRPEVVETVPKPMAPQGEVGMPAPPPTPRVAVPEEKSPIEVTAQPSEAKLTPETGAVKETQIAEAEAKRESPPYRPLKMSSSTTISPLFERNRRSCWLRTLNG